MAFGLSSSTLLVDQLNVMYEGQSAGQAVVPFQLFNTMAQHAHLTLACCR
jgi:hypothetical protein